MSDISARIAKAKDVDLVAFMSKLGFDPVIETGSLCTYYSPLRSEKVASFTVSKKSNSFYDYGLRSGGDILDLVQQLEKVNLPKALDIVLGQEHIQKREPKPLQEQEPAIKIHAVKPIISPELRHYLTERKISPEIAIKWLVELEISFTYGKHPERIYHVLGWRNDSLGFEMRNGFFKISNSPKNITTIKGSVHDRVLLFEGWPDYLTYLSMWGEQPYDTIVLNSVSFLPIVIPMIRGKVVHSYLDNDTAGDDAVALLKTESFKVIDCRLAYKGNKDLNEKICKTE